jgi:hypothetical protein
MCLFFELTRQKTCLSGSESFTNVPSIEPTKPPPAQCRLSIDAHYPEKTSWRTFEANECLKAWWRNSPIEQQFGYFRKQTQKTARLVASTAGPKFVLRNQTHSFSTTLHFWLYLPNAGMTVDVEVKVLTSLISVTETTATCSVGSECLRPSCTADTSCVRIDGCP